VGVYGLGRNEKVEEAMMGGQSRRSKGAAVLIGQTIA